MSSQIIWLNDALVEVLGRLYFYLTLIFYHQLNTNSLKSDKICVQISTLYEWYNMCKYSSILWSITVEWTLHVAYKREAKSE